MTNRFVDSLLYDITECAIVTAGEPKMYIIYDYQRIRNQKRKIELLDIMEAKHRVRGDKEER